MIANEQLDERTVRLKRLNVQRVQQCRARKQAGARMVRIEVTDWAETLDAFVRIGVLADDERKDERALERAIAQLCRAGFRAVEARQKASA
ncbi:hypothetical protein Q2941_36480 [Bradyrhizobium sp. UFLA05-153]